jgi:hypothetical protein
VESINAIVEVARFGLNVEYTKAYVSSENIKNMTMDSFVGLSVDTDSLFSVYLANNETVPVKQDYPTAQNIRENYTEVHGAKLTHDEEVTKLADAELRHRVIAELLSKKMSLVELATTYKG